MSRDDRGYWKVTWIAILQMMKTREVKMEGELITCHLQGWGGVDSAACSFRSGGKNICLKVSNWSTLQSVPLSVCLELYTSKCTLSGKLPPKDFPINFLFLVELPIGSSSRGWDPKLKRHHDFGYRQHSFINNHQRENPTRRHNLSYISKKASRLDHSIYFGEAARLQHGRLVGSTRSDLSRNLTHVL